MTILDRESPIPLYYQLKQILLEKINGAEWKPGDLIPSEQELQESFGLSRTTVRQTLSEMVHEGLLNRQRGRGTFVAFPQMTHDPAKRLGWSEYLQEQGIEPGWQMIEAGWTDPPDGVRAKLGIKENGRIYRIHRLRLANGTPIGYHYAYLPEFMVEYINEDDFSNGGSLRYMRKAPQMNRSLANRTIEATLADKPEMALLGAKKGAPILTIERIVKAEDGTPLELLWAAYLGERFKYQVTI